LSWNPKPGIALFASSRFACLFSTNGIFQEATGAAKMNWKILNGCYLENAGFLRLPILVNLRDTKEGIALSAFSGLAFLPGLNAIPQEAFGTAEVVVHRGLPSWKWLVV
jgi:hypothetical protein